MASSNTRARFIFLLKSKSKASRRLPTSRKPVCFIRRSRSRSCRRTSSCWTRREKIDGGQLLGLRFEQAGLQPGGEAGAAALLQGGVAVRRRSWGDSRRRSPPTDLVTNELIGEINTFKVAAEAKAYK